jgi:hypothetical protein
MMNFAYRINALLIKVAGLCIYNATQATDIERVTDDIKVVERVEIRPEQIY